MCFLCRGSPLRKKKGGLYRRPGVLQSLRGFERRGMTPPLLVHGAVPPPSAASHRGYFRRGTPEPAGAGGRQLNDNCGDAQYVASVWRGGRYAFSSESRTLGLSRI